MSGFYPTPKARVICDFGTLKAGLCADLQREQASQADDQMTKAENRAPGFELERALGERGLRCIAGVDEVGRGPLAGPVTAAAVIFPPDIDEETLLGIRDSKELTAGARERLAALVLQRALDVRVGWAPAREVDAVGIVGATRRAMMRAINKLEHRPEGLLIDAVTLPGVALPQLCPVKGDRVSLSIAAASIVAKVARDKLMEEADHKYPGYGFCRNKGYGTRQHIGALERQGPCRIHRVTFAPVARCNGFGKLV